MNPLQLSISLLLLFYNFVWCLEEDTEVVFLPAQWNRCNGTSTVPLSFTAFGKKIDLLLSKNENLLSPNFEIWKRKSSNKSEKIGKTYEDLPSCHYIYEDESTSAAFSLCDFGAVHGFVFLKNASLEITPLSSNEAAENFFGRKSRSVGLNRSPGKPHAVRRRKISPLAFLDKRIAKESQPEVTITSNDDDKNKTNASLTIELALFLDAAAYRSFGAYFAIDVESRLLDMLLAYVNNVQALYYHPSLGERVRIALVRVELMQRQPDVLVDLDGERAKLLDEFCAYSKSINPRDDDDPRHWDIGLYVSGLDFYAIEERDAEGATTSVVNPVTMGLAPVGGVCWDDFGCVIAEFGVNDALGKPYPSAGFTSVYIAAHEIAHNLGMHHDSSGNDCPREGYIMSPSRGVQGETTWSRCSRKVASELARSKPCLLDRSSLSTASADKERERLDHGRFAETPGRQYTAKRQCQILLKDDNGYAETAEGSCTIKCKSTDKSDYYFAGPGLDGTQCGDGKECRAGDCVDVHDDRQTLPPSSTPDPIAPVWSDWRTTECRSGCVRGSLGYHERRRDCLGNSVCHGHDHEVTLCKDQKLCHKRIEVNEYAGQRCRVNDARSYDNGAPPGLQADHEIERPWIACVLFCRRGDVDAFYGPLDDVGRTATPDDTADGSAAGRYFPDGTWCHRNASTGENYFCRAHRCLPESFRFGNKGPNNENGKRPMNFARLTAERR